MTAPVDHSFAPIAGLRLRALEPGDLDCLYIWENDPGMWRYGFSPAPYSRQQLWEYINGYDADPLTAGELRLIVDVGGMRVGTVDLYDIDIYNRRAMVGVMIDARFRRKGYAKAALEKIGSYCLDNLGLHQLAAFVSENNHGSCSLFESSGYRRVATVADWHREGNSFTDAILYQLILG